MSYVGLDIGTTSIRALAFAEDGSVLATSSRLLPIDYPAPNRVEQDPSVIAQCSVEALEDIARQIDGMPRAIGIANQRETVIAWEKHTLLPLSMAISWQDRRGAARCSELKKMEVQGLVKEITGLPLDPYFSATKYAQIVSDLAAIPSKKIALGTVDSWLIANLTSNENPLTDLTNASRTSLLNITSNKYEDELGALFEVPIDLLPAPLPSDAMFGEICHPDLESWRGTPIHAVLGDQQASLFAQGCIDRGDTKATLGTGTFILTNTGDRTLGPYPALIDSIAWNLSGIGNTYCLEGSIFSTHSTLQWLIDVLGIASNIEELDALAKSVRTSEQVTLLPFFSGSGSPWWEEGSGAVLAGLDTSSSKGQIAKAGFESVALQIASVIIELQTALGNRIELLRLDGGLSHIDSLCQLIADQTNLESQTAFFAESTAFGAAMMSAVGLGDMTPENVRDLYKSRNIFVPAKGRMGAKSREKRWNLYLEKLGLLRE